MEKSETTMENNKAANFKALWTSGCDTNLFHEWDSARRLQLHGEIHNKIKFKKS